MADKLAIHVTKNLKTIEMVEKIKRDVAAGLGDYVFKQAELSVPTFPG